MSAVWSIGREPKRRREGPACIYCGCTEARACPGGCSWTRPVHPNAPPVCSACRRIEFELDQALNAACADKLLRLGVGPGPLPLGVIALEYLRYNGARLDRWGGRGKVPPVSPPAKPQKPSIPVSHRAPRGKVSNSAPPRGGRRRG